ncbi:GIY-YIG nuclease family protein [Olleya marilimosa]|uniref:GIY-YIG catalytic domain-containing protein n=1 Tax=Olleya marilimosa TaxID=272164 RepID=A0ABR8LNU9_9FLAO|nr:hypothetical protein [Olleya marilimosa]MBD3861906.1 hypothetical protein [Olleya marilimosa]MBD3889406.1 hypothetical protein [Olleya marilimosa]
MKGKKLFTQNEFEQLKILVQEKQKADKTKQKNIRSKIRKIGFFFTDFSAQKKGYDITDLNYLIKTGAIKIVEKTNRIENTKVLTEKKINVESIKIAKTSNLSRILIDFSKNRFEPNIHFESEIPDTCGNYIICLRKDSKLPDLGFNIQLGTFDSLKVIYTGIAGTSLKKRDYRQHFNGNSGSSTLRKSLGILFNYKLIPRDKNPDSRKTKFELNNELELSEWMNLNLIMYFFPNLNFDDLENKLIEKFNPPLNLSKNKNLINENFRKKLSKLRSSRL